MTIEEIKQAISEGKRVCYECSSNIVVLVSDWVSPLSTGLGVFNPKHKVVIGLCHSALDDCFIFGEV